MRANALLLLDDGMSCEEIAKVLYLDDDTIRYWYQLYREKGPEWLADFGYKGRACDHAGLPCKVARAICPDRAGSEMMMAGRLPVHVADHQVEAFCMLAAMRPRMVPSPTNPTTTLSLDITSPSLPFPIFDRHREASCAAHIEEGPACAKGEMRDELGGHGGQRLGRSVTRGTYHFRRRELPPTGYRVAEHLSDQLAGGVLMLCPRASHNLHRCLAPPVA